MPTIFDSSQLAAPLLAPMPWARSQSVHLRWERWPLAASPKIRAKLVLHVSWVVDEQGQNADATKLHRGQNDQKDSRKPTRFRTHYAKPSCLILERITQGSPGSARVVEGGFRRWVPCS